MQPHRFDPVKATAPEYLLERSERGWFLFHENESLARCEWNLAWPEEIVLMIAAAALGDEHGRTVHWEAVEVAPARTVYRAVLIGDR